MKKVTRILSLLVILGICLSFCGCQTLDELRGQRAFIAEDGVIHLYDGTQYKPMPEDKGFSSDLSDYEITEAVIVVDEEMPLLLTYFGDYAFICNDGQILYVYTDTDTHYYCRSDVYDSVLARIQNSETP